MKIRFVALFSIATALVASSTTAQTFTLPTTVVGTSQTSVPFGSVRMRYQIWFSAAEWNARLDRPVAITGLDLMTAQNGQTGRQIQFEVRMANSLPFSPTGVFQNNMVSGETLMFPATQGGSRAFTTPTTVAGGFAVQLPFANEFIWDGQSGVVVDFKIYDNGNQNQPYPYDLRIENFGGNRIQSVWTSSGNPDASFADVVLSRGPLVRFRFRDGVSVGFGDGCPGQGFTIPRHFTTGGDPVPGNQLWTQELRNAPSQRGAIWMFGDSRTQWLSLALPHELVEIGGLNCFLLVKPDLTFSTTTVGSPGAGSASLNTSTPPTSALTGLDFFTQWLILDPLSPNGVIAMSNGMRHRFGP